jgi:GAF domain-containing protein/predicted pyridoxine 5'-phosphate oxidase superfamily flavin-nucleotide-binding protein
MSDTLDLRDLHLCFEGAVPAVIATASSDGVPNITYLSRVRMVDNERVALSNQFFSKTARNLAENARASVLVFDPCTYDMYRMTLIYERTERRGPIFERLRDDVDAVAAAHGVQDVFCVRAADIYRVVAIEQTVKRPLPEEALRRGPAGPNLATGPRLAELSTRLSRCPDLDALVEMTVDGLAQLLGYEHTILLLADEQCQRLYTIASHGYEDEGVGSEVVIGEGMVGLAALRCATQRIGNLFQVRKYARWVGQAYADQGIGPGQDIPMPLLTDIQSRVAVPAMAMGHLIGVLVAESPEPVAFDENDESTLGVVAALVASAVEGQRTRVAATLSAEPAREAQEAAFGRSTLIRHFPVDGSTFVNGDYLIKGVAGRILWSLLSQYQADGRVEFTNREVRLDPTLELPEYRDNFENRLILLKRRLAEREALISIEKTGRGRFRVEVAGNLRLESSQ